MYHLSQYRHIFLLVDIAMYGVPKQNICAIQATKIIKAPRILPRKKKPWKHKLRLARFGTNLALIRRLELLNNKNLKKPLARTQIGKVSWVWFFKNKMCNQNESNKKTQQKTK